jgi:hypothetical protein
VRLKIISKKIFEVLQLFFVLVVYIGATLYRYLIPLHKILENVCVAHDSNFPIGLLTLQIAASEETGRAPGTDLERRLLTIFNFVVVVAHNKTTEHAKYYQEDYNDC